MLFKATLERADLSEAYVSQATDITIKELEQEAASLESATMPDGQKYEELLKATCPLR